MRRGQVVIGFCFATGDVGEDDVHLSGCWGVGVPGLGGFAHFGIWRSWIGTLGARAEFPIARRAVEVAAAHGNVQ
jgi:hypothetical protein